MSDDPRWDPEMRAAHAAYELAVAAAPPLRGRPPFDPQRVVSDALLLPQAQGGPAMAHSADRWVLGQGRRILCRVHLPFGPAQEADEVLPALVYLHGGGWVWSSVDTHDRIAREYAHASGCVVISVDYALSPEARFPRALEECASVVRWLGTHGAEWGIDPARIAVGGDSAGGNLALGVALLLRDSGGPLLCGVLAIYPVCAADFTTPSYREFGGDAFYLTREAMKFYWNCYAPNEADRLNPLCAPLRADMTGLPPVLLHLAELDVLRSEGEALAVRLSEAGVPVELHIFPGVIHGFLRAAGSVARAREALASGGAWLRRTLTPRAKPDGGRDRD